MAKKDVEWSVEELCSVSKRVVAFAISVKRCKINGVQYTNISMGR